LRILSIALLFLTSGCLLIPDAALPWRETPESAASLWNIRPIAQKSEDQGNKNCLRAFYLSSRCAGTRGAYTLAEREVAKTILH